jgi:phytoene synthase
MRLSRPTPAAPSEPREARRPVLEPRTLSAAYERCRQLHARHGRTYYLATLLLPRWKRRHVHALYGFTRYADEIVDDLASTLDGAGQAAALDAWGRRFFAGLQGAPCDDPVLPAVLHTVRAFDLDLCDFEQFLHSMAMDLRTGGYRTYQDLCGYMEGSAAVIGTLMAPILESSDPPAAREHARQLGLAFQLTNFIRDVAEDLARGRVYLPAEDLERFGVRRADLAADQASPAVRELLAFEVTRARAHYRAAEPGIDLLAPSPGRVSGSPSTSTAASSTRSSGPATRSSTAGSGSPATAALVWPAATGPPPGPPPAPNAGSASPPPARDEPTGRAGPGRRRGRAQRVPALG